MSTNYGGAGPSSRASSMRPPPNPPARLPLMTPSASPPVRLPFGRHSDGPSPTKKRRISRTPSLLGPGARSYSVASASSSSVSPAFTLDASVEPGDDLHAARRASSFRVLNIWSQLADKYSRRLDEDDIVDLEKEKVIKDYGVLRSSGDIYQIGCFADEQERAGRLDNGLPLTPVDDEPDELDAFADIGDNNSRSETDGDEEDELGLSQRTKRLPPVRELDPADAADLEEFLNAERSRKELYGDPDEVEEDYEDFGTGEEDYEEGDGRSSEGQEEKGEEDNDGEDNFGAGTTTSKSDVEGDTTVRDVHSSGDEQYTSYQERLHDDDDDDERAPANDYRRLSTPSGSPEFDILDVSNGEKESDYEEDFVNAKQVDEDGTSDSALPLPPDTGSEDELGGWDHDEGSILYSVGDFDDNASSEEDQESVKEHTPTPPPPPSPRKRKNHNENQKPKPSSKAPPVRKQPQTPSKKEIRKEPSTSLLPSSSPAVQLQTPPRSTSFGPEGRGNRPSMTYSRKGRGKSSSPKKTPLRIASTASSSSDSEVDSAPLPLPKTSEKPKQPKPRPRKIPVTPIKKNKLVPEVYIDTPRQTSPRKASPDKQVQDKYYDSIPEKPVIPQKSEKAKGKSRAIEADSYTSSHEPNRSPKSASGKTTSPIRPHQSVHNGRDKSPEQIISASKKRRRGYSPDEDKPSDSSSANDVLMLSPRSSSRISSRRVSSSRKSIVNEDYLYDERAAGPSSKRSTSRRARSRPSGEHHPENAPRPPELNAFTFTPPQPTSGFQNYAGSPFAPPLAQLQQAAALPSFQDVNAKYHLAQALQSLSYLMGSTLPFPASPMGGVPPPAQHTQPPWPPYTPQHHNRTMNFETPQSAASAPPTSSPIGSDYTESLPSSPSKRPDQDRGRVRTHRHDSSTSRPKSAIREVNTPSRSRMRSHRRVSFSSPEAFHIEDNAYELYECDVIEVESTDAEDSDVERRRVRREAQSSRTVQLLSTPRRLARAQTPAPPGPPSTPNDSEIGHTHTAYKDLDSRRKVIKRHDSHTSSSTSKMRRGIARK